jgi:hypothetical protein
MSLHSFAFITLGKVLYPGRAIAQAVSYRLPTAAARVRAQVNHVGFVIDKVALGQVSPANSHSTECSTFIIIHHPGLVQQAN